MHPQSSVTESGGVEATWREIESVVQAVARQARSDVPAARFFAELLDGGIRTLAAVSGAVWLRHPDGLRLEYQINLAKTGLPALSGENSSPDDQERARQHQRLLDQVLRQNTSQLLGARSGAGDGADSADAPSDNPTDYLLLLCPIATDRDVQGVLEIFQRPNVSPAASQGYLRFLGTLAQLAADYLRNSRFRDLEDRASLWNQFEQFTERVHHGLDEERISAAIASEGRLLIQCDRVSVAVRRGRRFRVTAISGADWIDRRSNVVRALEDLIRLVVTTREPFWFHAGSSDGDVPSPVPALLPPRVEAALQNLMTASPTRVLGILPLLTDTDTGDHQNSPRDKDASPSAAPAPPVGALVVERFDGSAGRLMRHRAEVVAKQSTLALENSRALGSIPFLPVLRLVGWLTGFARLRQLPKTILAVGTVSAVIAALVLIPSDFTIDGRGELQPAVRRGIYAATDGVVSHLDSRLSGGEAIPVAAGDVLVDLTNSDLDFELTRVLGELRTARQSLATSKVEQLNVDDRGPRWQEELQRLAAHEKELEETIRGLDAQLEILKRQQTELRLTSPINGQILTWNAGQLLESRPVRRGERLLEVADVNGPWVLEVRVADQNIGHIHDARRDGPSDLKVRFVLATDPHTTYDGRVVSVASDTRSHSEDGPTVLVTVEIDRTAIPAAQLRPGATVIPHIHCGQRPIGFVWFHELLHVVWTRLLF